ncbi:MAG TPA: efflux RND transporter periplasmic adaptor subunit [Kofleriaceae bacterium]|nr:efflux RND transporter periplasmic adaptor subunit [Kofleriaceae bacterium]
MWRSLTLSIALAGCTPSPTLEPYSASSEHLRVTRGALEEHVLLTGELDAADSIQLSVPRTNTWQLSIRWLATEGSHVEEGARLVEFDNSALVQQLRDLELAIIRADNDLAAHRASSGVQVADKELEVERQRVEVAKAALDAAVPPSLISQREWHDYRLALERAQTAHASAVDELAAARKAADLEQEVKQIELDKAERTYERSAKQLDQLVLRAPVGGVLIVADHPWFGRRLQVGDVVQPGFAAVKVSNIATMEVVAQLSDVDDGRIAVDMPVRCVLDAYPDRPFTGRIAEISEIAQAHSESSTRRFFKVTVALDQTDSEVMRPGMSVRVDVLTRAEADVLVAPRAALHSTATEWHAALAGGGERPVEIGFCTAQACTITSGLREGDELRRARERTP